MSIIKIYSSGSGDNNQFGDNNKMIVSVNPLSRYEEELLLLFNKYCTTEDEKRELISDLNVIELNGPKKEKSAGKLLSFLSSITAGLVSNGITIILQDLIKGK